jgi:hypothetical protein
MEPDQKRAADVLVRWREVERAMEDPAIGQAAMEALQDEADRLRDEYQRLVSPQATTSDRPD